MKTTLSATERLQGLLTLPTDGIVGLVDELLTVARYHNLQLDWQAGHCRVRIQPPERSETVEVPLRKSVFRAILARIAALCSESSASGVSPYGGRGELSIGNGNETLFRIDFTNTAGEQRLEIIRASAAEA